MLTNLKVTKSVKLWCCLSANEMSKDYNSRLKPVHYKGLCGDPEIVDPSSEFNKKCKTLVALVKQSNRIVLFTGAGISTSCGIADFRGPNGVWTKEQRGEEVVASETGNETEIMSSAPFTKLSLSLQEYNSKISSKIKCVYFITEETVLSALFCWCALFEGGHKGPFPGFDVLLF